MKSWPFPMSDDNGEPISTNERATRCGIRFMHFMTGSNPCTIAYCPVNRNKNCKMLEVSVAYKHPKDQYTKKIGSTLAAERMFDGEFIILPLKGKTNYETMFNLQLIFES